MQAKPAYILYLKWLGVFLLSPGWDISTSQSYPQYYTHFAKISGQWWIDDPEKVL